MKKKLLVIFALLCAVAQGAWSENVVNLSFLTQNYVAEYGDVLTGRLLFPVKISINHNAHVTLRNVSILGVDDGSYGYSGITCLGNATITLEGDNEVCGFYRYQPGIQLGPENTTLTIKGDGSLYAYSHGCFGIGPDRVPNSGNLIIEGGNITAVGAEDYPGIGTSDKRTIGNITLKGGTIRAYGGKSAPGIGGGWKGNCGTITIDGSTVYAYGGDKAPGIGCRDGDDDYGRPNKEGINIHILSGYVEAYGGESAAGIGGGNRCNGGTITIDGGTVKAYGGGDGAGIGGGYTDHGGSITINGGTITATGGSEGAGIGGGEDGSGGEINISGGTITATGGDYAAGIGGGDAASGGTIRITGGDIKAYGGTDGAGIGGGEDGNSGSIYISGGDVYALGKDYGVGIGAGEDGDVDYISISGGKIKAEGGMDIMRAVGGEDDEDYYSSHLSIGDGVKVIFHVGSIIGDMLINYSDRSTVMKNGRLFDFVPCDHEPRAENTAYTAIDPFEHKFFCQYCGPIIESHTYDSEDRCIVCNYYDPIHKVHFLEMEYDEERNDYIYHEVSELEITVPSFREFTMPMPIFTNLKDLVFAGWVKGIPYVENYPWLSGYDKPVQPGVVIMMEEQDLYYTARYRKREGEPEDDTKYLTFTDGMALTSELEEAMGQTFDITFQGRQFIINSEWNTLCLPLSMTAEQIGNSPLANGKIVELET